MAKQPLPNYDRTVAERQRRARARGRQVSALLVNADAIAAWDVLVQQHGSQRAALEALLTQPSRQEPP